MQWKGLLLLGRTFLLPCEGCMGDKGRGACPEINALEEAKAALPFHLPTLPPSPTPAQISKKQPDFRPRVTSYSEAIPRTLLVYHLRLQGWSLIMKVFMLPFSFLKLEI